MYPLSDDTVTGAILNAVAEELAEGKNANAKPTIYILDCLNPQWESAPAGSGSHINSLYIDNIIADTPKRVLAATLHGLLPNRLGDYTQFCALIDASTRSARDPNAPLLTAWLSDLYHAVRCKFDPYAVSFTQKHPHQLELMETVLQTIERAAQRMSHEVVELRETPDDRVKRHQERNREEQERVANLNAKAADQANRTHDRRIRNPKRW